MMGYHESCLPLETWKERRALSLPVIFVRHHAVSLLFLSFFVLLSMTQNPQSSFFTMVGLVHEVEVLLSGLNLMKLNLHQIFQIK